MTSTALKFATLHTVLAISVGLIPALSQAQQVYRIVGADGKVTFSDQPPQTSQDIKVTAASADSGGAASVAGLPYELRQVANKYPVTLYSGDNCAPCTSGRALLTNRGIPFSEKTVTSVDDAQALKRLSGDNSLPFLTIGRQQLKGFSDAEWTQFLDAAGYPKSSKLPANYRSPAPAPLVATASAAASVNQPPPAPVDPQTGAPLPTASGTAGIRF
jgi:glutaredoxin